MDVKMLTRRQLFALLIPATLGAGDDDASRDYHLIPLSALGKESWTHVEVEATVKSVRKQGDGDYHITLTDGAVEAVAEIIPTLFPPTGPMRHPRAGKRVRIRGIQRLDGRHKWPEIHPVESWTYV
jgi:hypothetical protein